MRSLFARSLMAVLTLGTLAVSHPATAQTDSNTETPVVLYGNEGLGIGTLPMGGTIPRTTGYSHPTLAQGFTVGEIGYVMTTIDVGLVMPSTTLTAIAGGTFALDIALFSSVEDVNGNKVPGERIVTFNPVPTNTVGGAFAANVPRLYTFGYLDETQSNKVTLEAGQSYWVIVSYVPLDNSNARGFSWQFAAGTNGNLPSAETPVERNTSGLTFLGTIGQHDFGSDWVDHGIASEFPNTGLSFSISGYEAPVIIDSGGGGEQTPPTLDCYALSKGFFKNQFSGWPASVVADGGALIGTQVYTIDQLKTMLSTNSTRGNQIGQLASQLVAVHLSRELARQTAGDQYLWWNGWAPDSAEAQAAYDQAAALINATAGFETHRGRLRLTGYVTGVGNLISALDGYIADNHCDDGDDDDDDRSCRRGRSRRDDDRDRCNKKLKYERRDRRKSHEC